MRDYAMREERQSIPGLIDELPASLLSGALGGLVATAPMTVAMEIMHQELPWWERYPLPPSQIISKITEELGLRKNMDQSEHVAATLIAHFAYGTAAGMVYAPLAKRVPLPSALKGIAFGLVVWTTSYLGLLPALGILRPATKHPARRNALMIAAHVVWGAALGAVVELAQPRDASDSRALEI
jgi:putative membrane protein